MYSLYSIFSHWIIAGPVHVACWLCPLFIIFHKSEICENITQYISEYRTQFSLAFVLCLVVSVLSNPAFYLMTDFGDFCRDDEVKKYTIRIIYNLSILPITFIFTLCKIKRKESKKYSMEAFRGYLEVIAQIKSSAQDTDVANAPTSPAPTTPPSQKPAAPFVADAGRGNSIWPILAAVLGGIALALIVAVVIIACE